jgi:uncharacterized membrane protein YqgA involved in biofilm formation
VNSAACLGGALLGLALGRFIPERVRQVVFQLFGLLLVPIALSMVGRDADMILTLLCVVLGGGLGEALRLGQRLESLGDRLKSALGSGNSRFSDGLVSSTIMVCAGAMAIVGAFEEGLGLGRTTILTKSLIDFFAVAIVAARMGSGAAWCALPVLVYQGSLTMAAGALQPMMTPAIEGCVSATGGILILGIGVNMMGLKPPIPISSVWPAMVLAVILPAVFG